MADDTSNIQDVVDLSVYLSADDVLFISKCFQTHALKPQGLVAHLERTLKDCTLAACMIDFHFNLAATTADTLRSKPVSNADLLKIFSGAGEIRQFFHFFLSTAPPLPYSLNSRSI